MCFVVFTTFLNLMHTCIFVSLFTFIFFSLLAILCWELVICGWERVMLGCKEIVVIAGEKKKDKKKKKNL